VKLIRLGFVLALFLAAQASAGVVFEIETKDQGSNEPGSVLTVIDGKNVKMVVTSGDGNENSEMIFHGDSREMVVVDHDERSYMVIDEAMMKSLGEKMSGYEAQMREALKDVPPEQRAMVEQMMKGRMPAATKAPAQPIVAFNNTGEHDTRNGYPSTKYEMTIGGHKTQDLWVTDWKNVDGGEEAVGAFQAMSGFFKQMRDSMPRFGGREDADDNPLQHMNEMKGFPVQTYEYARDGSIAGESSLLSSVEKAVDSAEFEPPSAYKRREMMPQ